MSINKVLIAVAIAFGCVLFNSCSCDNWFNNGCEFHETFLGGLFK